MVNVNNVYSSGNWLSAEDLQGPVTVAIEAVSIEQFNDGKPENKLALQFRGAKKRLLCNKTNAKRLAYMFGEETDHWIGKQVTIAVEMVDYKGDYVPGLRIQAQPQPTAIQPAPQQPAQANSGGMVPVQNAGYNQDPNYTGQSEIDDDVPF